MRYTAQLTLILITISLLQATPNLVPSNDSLNPLERIVGGYQQSISNRPFQVAVFPGGYICGGSLIAWDWVVSAAHCTEEFDPYDIVVSAGSNRAYDGVFKDVSIKIEHPSYNPTTNDFDISLLKLSSRYYPSQYINTIRLATYTPPDYSLVVVSGYGVLSSNGPNSDSLMEVKVSLVPWTTCSNAYGPVLTHNMICAGQPGIGGKDSCQGDSGGPLTYNNELIGVVSFGYGCGDPAFPGVYTDVIKLTNWISNTMSYF